MRERGLPTSSLQTPFPLHEPCFFFFCLPYKLALVFGSTFSVLTGNEIHQDIFFSSHQRWRLLDFDSWVVHVLLRSIPYVSFNFDTRGSTVNEGRTFS
jgi:hypothetical protein